MSLDIELLNFKGENRMSDKSEDERYIKVLENESFQLKEEIINKCNLINELKQTIRTLSKLI